MKRVIAFLFAAIFVFSCSSWAFAGNFNQWLIDVRKEARAQGVSEKTVRAALPDTLKPIPRVLELDKKQPEKTKTINEYLKSVVSDVRIKTGSEKMSSHAAILKKISEQYGVEPQVMVALWGIETNFGQNTGGFNIIPALATLAYDGRRSAFFREELIKALHILDEGHISLANMKGSWAGAMGQCQFMPSSFHRFAEDYNQDGKRDIWATHADVFASTANYLSKSGWKKGEPWGRKVLLPKTLDKSLLGLDVGTKSLQYWHDKGVRLPDGKPIPFEGVYQAAIIQPKGMVGEGYIVYDNYRVIMKWNKSTYFATAVGTLADKIKVRAVPPVNG